VAYAGFYRYEPEGDTPISVQKGKPPAGRRRRRDKLRRQDVDSALGATGGESRRLADRASPEIRVLLVIAP
jgi:hypothetical protein